MARRAPAVERSIAVLNLPRGASGRALHAVGDRARRPISTRRRCTRSSARSPSRGSSCARRSARPTASARRSSRSAAPPSKRTPRCSSRCRTWRRLSNELGLDCVASTAIEDQIVILAADELAASVRHHVEPGQRLPLSPPLGTVFVAWSSPGARSTGGSRRSDRRRRRRTSSATGKRSTPSERAVTRSASAASRYRSAERAPAEAAHARGQRPQHPRRRVRADRARQLRARTS